MDWTNEQREAIETRHKSMLVSAAAGSGKTAVLVERIKQLIRQDQVGLDEMLVVTFTNAAASEMREKIVSAIPEQLHQIHKSHISTFHAFALDVIKRYFHLIQIEPQFKICDDTQRILLQNEAMEQLFEEKFREKDQAFLNFLTAYASSKNEETPKEMILDLHTFIQSMPDPFDWLSDRVEALQNDVGAFLTSQAFREIRDDIHEELEMAIQYGEKVMHWVLEENLVSLLGKAEEDRDMLLSIRDQFQENFELGAESIRNSSFARFVATKEDKGTYEGIKDDIKVLRDEAKECVKRIKAQYCGKKLSEYVTELQETHREASTLKELVIRFDELYRQRKQKKGVIDFSDIEHYALAILRHEEAATEYRDKFQYIFIDEYQDSNLVQESIIQCIKRPDNVFMVGDVKQSIYKFRLAEPDIFLKQYESCRSGQNPDAMKLDLNRNFRSKGNIINLVNHTFSSIMNRRTAGMAYDEDAALYQGVDYKGPLDYPVELHLVDDRAVEDPGLDDEIREMKRAELEAVVAAGLIKESKGLPFYDAKEGRERRLQNNDMVILLRATAQIGEVYREALEKEGIPAYLDLGDGYFDTLEVSVLLNLLKLLDNGKQDVPLLSVLRSPIFGYSIEELARIRTEQKRGAYHNAFRVYAELGLDLTLRNRCVTVQQKIQSWRRRTRFMPLSDFLWELILDSGYYSYVGALPGGVGRQANLRALVDKAITYEGGQASGLFGFINYIEAMKKGKISTAPVKLVGESDDVVRIMTVHKSKGLEFPLVLVGNLGRSFHREKGSVISLQKDLGLSLRRVDRNRRCWNRTILQNAIDRRRTRESLAEEIRVLYVALTRPMDRLLLLGTVSNREQAQKTAELKAELGILKGNSYLDYLLPALENAKGLLRGEHDRTIAGAAERSRQEQRAKTLVELEDGFLIEDALEKAVASRLNWQYGYQTAFQIKSKYSVTELGKAESATRDPKPQTKSAKEAAERGTLYHTVMEHLPFDQGALDEQDIRNWLNRMVESERLTRVEADAIQPSEIAAFFRSEIGRRVTKATQVYREVPFNLLRERDGEAILVQGIIDCYFEEKGRYVLMDYKSNAISDASDQLEHIVDLYRPQLTLYKEALEEIRGIQIDEMYLYLIRLGKEVRIPLEKTDTTRN